MAHDPLDDHPRPVHAPAPTGVLPPLPSPLSGERPPSLTVAQMATLGGVTPRTLYEWRTAHGLPPLPPLTRRTAIRKSGKRIKPKVSWQPVRFEVAGMPAVISTAQAAVVLGLNINTVHLWLKKGRLRRSKRSTTWRTLITRASVVAMFKAAD